MKASHISFRETIFLRARPMIAAWPLLFPIVLPTFGCDSVALTATVVAFD